MTTPKTLTELFDASVAKHSDRPAVSDAEATLTYRELDEKANRLANALLRHGVELDHNVGIYLERGVGVIVAMVGIMKAGAAYLSVDADYPDSRRDLMLRDGRVRVVVTHQGWADRFRSAGEFQVLEWETIADSAAPVVRRPWPANAACILYTSGSTGEPKGIVLEHRNLVALATNPSLPVLGEDDKFGQISSPSFDGITLETWAALAAGAEVAVLAKIGSQLPTDLRLELKRRRVTTMLVPATVLNEICRVDREAFSPLRHLCSGGDVILPATCRALLGGGFDGDFHNLYGPSEITTAATAFRIDTAAEDTGVVPIGTALAEYRTQVLDDDQRPVPKGEVGELFIGGAGLARGYLGRPGLTAERFVPDPFGAGERLYASGDRVRENDRGQLEYLGRVDGQVKIRGHRVEPAEVEHAIAAHADVREAAVLVEEYDGDRRLAAFVVSTADDLSVGELRSFLSDSLPTHMMPAAISVIPVMPLTSNGKRDRAALAGLSRQSASRRAHRAAPETDTERWLVALWEHFLGVEDVGVTDDFFSLGGHSLLAFRVRSAVNKEFSVKVESHILFEHSTPRALAEIIDLARDREGAILP